MRLLFPLLLLLQLGTAHAALFDDKEARRGVAEAKQQITELQARLTDLQAQLAESTNARQVLEKRLAETEAFGKKQAFDQLAQIERLNAEISRLRGLLELNAHNVELAQQRQRDLYGDLDARLRKLESAPTAASTSSATDTAPPAAASTADSAAELASYEAAHELFKAGKHKESVEAFEKFLVSYPAGKYAPNAQYWLGYAYFSQKNYKAAMASQQKLISTYPDHQKVPDAMYNIANSQIQLADVEGARKTLRTLLDKHPQSETAPLAKKRLAVLESIKSK